MIVLFNLANHSLESPDSVYNQMMHWIQAIYIANTSCGIVAMSSRQQTLRNLLLVIESFFGFDGMHE